MSKSYFEGRNFRDKKILQFGPHSNWANTHNFLSAIWVAHSHLWAIIEGRLTQPKLIIGFWSIFEWKVTWCLVTSLCP